MPTARISPEMEAAILAMPGTRVNGKAVATVTAKPEPVELIEATFRASLDFPVWQIPLETRSDFIFEKTTETGRMIVVARFKNEKRFHSQSSEVQGLHWQVFFKTNGDRIPRRLPICMGVPVSMREC